MTTCTSKEQEAKAV